LRIRFFTWRAGSVDEFPFLVVTSVALSAWFQAAKFYSHFAPAFPRQLAWQEGAGGWSVGANWHWCFVWAGGLYFCDQLEPVIESKIDRFYALTAAGKAPGVAIDRR